MTTLSRARYVSRKDKNENKEKKESTNFNQKIKFEKVYVNENRRNTYKRTYKNIKKEDKKISIFDKDEKRTVDNNDDAIFKNSIRNKYKRKKMD
jgi:hypothetical protein